MRRVLITSQKGGVGKTTTAVNLAVLAASDERRVLLLDTDAIGSVEAGLNLSPTTATAVQTREYGVRGRFYDAGFPGLDVLAIDSEGSFNRTPAERVEGLLATAPAGREYQVVVIDSSPSKSVADYCILEQCDEILLIQRAEPLSLHTLPPLLEAIREKVAHGKGLRFHGVILSLAAGAGTTGTAAFRSALGESLGSETLPHDPEVERALLLGKPVVLVEPKCPAATQFRSLGAKLGFRENPQTKVVVKPTPPWQGGEVVKPEDPRANAWETMESVFPDAQKHAAPSVAPPSPEPEQYSWIIWVLIALLMGCLLGVILNLIPK